MYTSMFTFAVIALFAMLLGLYFGIQFIRFFKFMKKKLRRIHENRINNYTKKKEEEFQNKPILSESGFEAKSDFTPKETIYEPEEEETVWEEDFEDNEEEERKPFFSLLKRKENKLPKTKPEPKSVSLKNRIYKKESWTQFNCDLDNIDHASVVNMMSRTQDDSYHYIMQNQEMDRIQQENSLINP